MGRYTVSKYAARAVGNDQQEALMYHREKLMWWASEVLKAHVFGGQWCPTDDEVCCAVGIADPLCVKCACEPVQTIPNLPPCYVTPDFTANFAVDANQESSAVPGSTYYIVSNVDGLTTGWGLRVGEIAVGNVFQLPTFGQVTLVGGGTYWLQTSTTPALYWPGIGATVVPDTSISIVSDYPMAAYVLPRTIIIETSVTGNDPWVEIYNDTEAGLFTGLDISIDDTPTAIRITYVEGDCQYGPFAGRLPLEIPTNSFRIVGGATTTALSPVPGGITEFFPWDQNEWTVSFNLKIAAYDPIATFIPLNAEARVPTGTTPYQMANFFGYAATYLGQEEYAINIQLVLSGGGTAYNRLIVFTGAWAVMSNGAWHNVTLVRNSPITGQTNAADFTLWVDNISYSGVTVVTSGSSFTVPVNLTYQEAPDYNTPTGIYIGDIFVFPCDFTINNLYIANHAATPVEVATICYPAAYTGNDGTWDRVLWVRARQPDNAFASPYIASNSSNSVNLFGAGDVTLVPDAPPWV